MMKRSNSFLIAAAWAAMLSGCSNEARNLGPSQPMTPPASETDPRIGFYQRNLYQVSQGGRYFSWYGCGTCHGGGAQGPLDLGDDRWRHGAGFDRVYDAIANRHGAQRFGARIPIEQLWQLTAYVRTLPQLPREKRARQDQDQRGEPTGSSWSGPL